MSLLLEVAFLITSKQLVSRKVHVRILLTFSVITKKLIQGYCFMPAMLHGHQAVLSFSHLTQTLQFFVQHISTSFFVLNCGSKRVCAIIFDSYPYIKFGQSLSSALLGFHALTGCDSVSSFCGKGKKRPWDTVRQNTAHQKALKLLGKDAKMKSKTCRECEKFVCSLYTTNSKAGNTVNQVRFWLFCQKQLKNEGIPPTHDSLVHHLERPKYIPLVWKKAIDAKQALLSPTESGWEMINESLRPILMTQDSAPKGLVELTTCNCKTSACRGALCICRRNEIFCTESCSCMADESCMNSFNVTIGSYDPEYTE